MNATPRIAITMGDPAGVGPEICLRFLDQSRQSKDFIPIVIGDYAVLQRVAEQPWNDSDVLKSVAPISVDDFVKFRPTGSCVIDVAAMNPADLEPGVVSAKTGAASYAYIITAIDAARRGLVDAVTTGPINKEATSAAGVPYPGHTEIFAAQTSARRACMMLTSQALTCSFVTTHVGYRDVPDLLSIERILDVIQLSHHAMNRLRQRTPRLVVCGLNPHAGESGLFGDREEERLIIPAIEQARSLGIDLEGPLPPDTAFLPWRREQTDCFICMYHDQGHIPLKALAFDLAVNITLGLPIIRTSVDHGTALDIAWQGRADVTSLSQAVQLATRLASDGRTP